MAARLKTNEVQRRTTTSRQGAHLIKALPGRDVFKGMLLTAFQVLTHMFDNQEDEGSASKDYHQLANPIHRHHFLELVPRASRWL